MPVLMIWRPDDKNAYGHAALQTEKYHMSFWPAGNIKDLGKTKAALASVPAALILHHQRDKYLEENRDPIQYAIKKVTDDDLDRVFEEFLEFNDIDPDDVAEVKARVARSIKDRRKEELKEMIEDGEDVDLSLSKTHYSFLPTLMREKNPSGIWSHLFHPGGNTPFAERAQSCTSFCYHLIELADKSKDTMTPIPLNGYTVLLTATSIVAPVPSKPILDVPTFEEIAKKHYI